MSAPSMDALAALWAGLGGAPAALSRASLPGDAPVWPASFAVATAAQASLGAAALAAAEWAVARGRAPRAVQVDRAGAAIGCSSRFRIDGAEPPMWDPLSGLYRCGDEVGSPGRVRLHANFAHHRDRALALLGLPPGDGTPREAVAEALRRRPAEAFETALAAAGGVGAALRDPAAWAAHPAAQAVAAEPLVAIERIGDAPPRPLAPGADAVAARPLAGLRVLDLTRILAGPVAGRLLAWWGADVLMVNGPALPNISAIADLSRGKRSAQLELADEGDRARLRALAADGHVFLQGYRPGALAARGFSPQDLAAAAPGIVCVSLAAWGFHGPWAGRRGFDSLVQTATGINAAEAAAWGEDGARALPVQILDHAAGHLLAAGALAALARQAREGGSWHVRVSLAGVGRWVSGLGRDPTAVSAPPPDIDGWWDAEEDSGFGRLQGLRSPVRFDGVEARPALPSMPPGSHPAGWLTATA